MVMLLNPYQDCQAAHRDAQPWPAERWGSSTTGTLSTNICRVALGFAARRSACGHAGQIVTHAEDDRSASGRTYTDTSTRTRRGENQSQKVASRKPRFSYREVKPAGQGEPWLTFSLPPLLEATRQEPHPINNCNRFLHKNAGPETSLLTHARKNVCCAGGCLCNSRGHQLLQGSQGNGTLRSHGRKRS
jgi:hypothetical protein